MTNFSSVGKINSLSDRCSGHSPMSGMMRYIGDTHLYSAYVRGCTHTQYIPIRHVDVSVRHVDVSVRHVLICAYGIYRCTLSLSGISMTNVRVYPYLSASCSALCLSGAEVTTRHGRMLFSIVLSTCHRVIRDNC